MGGFLHMLKALGLDPDMLKKQAEDFLGQVDTRFKELEARVKELEENQMSFRNVPMIDPEYNLSTFEAQQNVVPVVVQQPAVSDHE